MYQQPTIQAWTDTVDLSHTWHTSEKQTDSQTLIKSFFIQLPTQEAAHTSFPLIFVLNNSIFHSKNTYLHASTSWTTVIRQHYLTKDRYLMRATVKKNMTIYHSDPEGWENVTCSEVLECYKQPGINTSCFLMHSTLRVHSVKITDITAVRLTLYFLFHIQDEKVKLNLTFDHK